MNRKSLMPLMGAGLLLLGVWGCKPSEKNYKAAYEVAMKRQQQEAYDADLDLDRTTLHKDGDPYLKVVGSDTVLWRKEHLAALDTADRMHRYNVAIAAFQMPTNVKAFVNRLRGEGYRDALAIKNGTPIYYVAVATFDSLPPAVSFVKEYKKSHPDEPYIGLPGAPVIEEAVRYYKP